MNTVLKRPTGRVRPACHADIEIIEAWLPVDGTTDSLAVNWPTTKRVYEDEGMLVWEDARSHEAVAYFSGTLTTTSSILEVRPSSRGQGIGRAFVEYLLEQSRAKGEPLLQIECAPSSSEQFWRSVGFSIKEEGQRSLGRQIIKLPQTLPEGPQCQVKVSFLHEGAIYDRERHISPLAEYALAGAQATSGNIILSEKVACFDLQGGMDLAVRIEIDGKEVYFDKAKYSEGAAWGITRCANGFAVGALSLANPGPR